MHILMISFDPALINQPDGEARARHREYARRAGVLTIITQTIAHSEGRAAVASEPSGLTIIPTNSRRQATFPFDALRLGMAYARRAEAPIDLITTQDMFLTGLAGAWLRRRLRVPLLVQNHSVIFENPAWLAENPRRNRVLLRLAKYVLGRADMVRTVNERERQSAIALGCPPERAVALPLATAARSFAVPADAEQLARLRAELGLLPEQPIVLWVGHPAPVKRVPLLLEAFRHVVEQRPDARLLLLGDASRSREDLPALAAALGIAEQVLMRGPVAHAKLPLYYALASIYAHTSAYEGGPRVMYEAAAAGLPLVAMDVVGPNEIIEHGVNGYLTPDNDPAALAQRIVELLNDPARARAFGAAAQRMAFERYDAATYADRWVGLWRQAIELGMRR